AASWTFVTDSMSRAEVFATDSMSRVEVSSLSRRRRFSSRSSASQSARLGPLASHFLPTTSTLTTTTAVIRDDAFPVMLGAETAGGHFDSEFLNFVGEFLSFFQFGRSDGRHDQAGRVAFSYRFVWARL